MEHSQIVNTMIGFHTAVLLAGAAAHYRVGDRSAEVARVRKYVRECLVKLRFKLRSRLSSLLRPVFQDTEVVRIGEILSLDGEPITQEVVNPEGSENYRNAIDSFVDDKYDAVIDFRIIKNSLSVWETSLWFRCWTILLLIAWQLISFSAIALPEKLFDTQVSNVLLVASAVPTIAGLFIYLITTAIAMFHHDRILLRAGQYE